MFYQFEFCWPTKHSCSDFHTIFIDVMQRECGFESYPFQYIDQTFCGVCTFLLKENYHFTGNLVTNMIKHVSEMELYVVLPTLKIFGNRTVLITKYHQQVKQCQVHVHLRSSYGYTFQIQNKYFNYFIQQHGRATTKIQ